MDPQVEPHTHICIYIHKAIPKPRQSHQTQSRTNAGGEKRRVVEQSLSLAHSLTYVFILTMTTGKIGRTHTCGWAQCAKKT